MKREKKVNHRHKWEQGYADCPFCGGGDYIECSCGEIKRLPILKKYQYHTPQEKKK